MDLVDAEVLAAMSAGERWAFDELYDRHAPTLARYAWSRLGTRELVEDVLQETFLVAWRKRSRIRLVDESVLPWLMVVCRNHINNSLRKVRRDSARQLDEAALVAVAPVNQLAWIEAEIRALSPADQAVCRLCLVEGVSYREAALLLGTTETAVGKRLQRARIRLRRALSDESWEVLPHD